MIGLVFTCLLYLLLHSTEKAKPGVYRSGSNFLSQISYTLYLVHLPLAVFLCARLNQPWHRWPKTLPNIAIAFALCAAIVAFAFAFYSIFEVNTNRVRDFVMRRSARPSLETAA